MLHVFSINNQVVSLDDRERFVLNSKQKERLYKEIREAVKTEVLILSTCQRFEVYTNNRGVVKEKTRSVLRSFFNLSAELFSHQFIEYSNVEALTHLLKVSTGLLAHVVGETQILGQVKLAYEEANNQKTVKKSFHTIFQEVLRFSKVMHKKTGINDHPVSLSYSAYQFIEKRVTTPKTILILGAGKMGKLFINYALKGQHSLIVLNRDQTKLQTLPENIVTGELSKWHTYIDEVDIIVSSLELESPLITKEAIKQRENHTSLLLIDLSLPRSIAGEVNELSDVKLFDLDQLGKAIDTHFFVRHQKAEIIAQAIKEEVKQIEKMLFSQQFDQEKRELFLERDRLLKQTMLSIQHQLPHLSEKELAVIRQHVKNSLTQVTIDQIHQLEDNHGF